MDSAVIIGGAVELIQLALAPVFLIVGIGQILNVATGRVARIIDRARWFDEQKRLNNMILDVQATQEIVLLGKRMRFVNWGITFLTGAAVVVCLDVILLIANGLVKYNFDQIILTLFIVSMTLMTGGLASFFIEVSLATASLKITLDRFK